MPTSTRARDPRRATREATAGASEPEVDAEVGALATRLRVEIGRLKRQIRQHTRDGLTPSQVSALASLDHHGPMRLGELARVESIAPPTLTKIMSGLEELGLVERSTDPSDRRSALVGITRAGRSALARIRNERNAFLARRVALLSPAERRRLADAVELITRLAEPEPPR
jgi:DNA-binding MarR family transcriptional regulator